MGNMTPLVWYSMHVYFCCFCLHKP